MKKKFLLIYALAPVLSALAPAIASAQFSLENSSFKTLVCYLLEMLSILNPIMIVVAFIAFFWGLSKFILNSGTPAEVTKGKNFMFWGILALFVLLSFGTIINIVASELEIGSVYHFPILPTGAPGTQGMGTSC